MPELPEVETVVRGLRAVLPGRRIVSVRLGKTDFIDEPAALGKRLPGHLVVAVERIGKFIDIALAGPGGPNGSHGRVQAAAAPPSGSDAPLHLLVHLGMTGRLAVRAPAEPIVPHTHAFFDLDDANELRYTDIRRFGRILLVPAAALPEFQSRLGDDALFVSLERFRRQLAGRRARIKAVLLDQRSLRGMGNIYADESLWRARIHPTRLASSLNAAEVARLHQSIRQVLRAAIKLGGSSISDFLDAEGKPGSYQMRHRVYGREGEKCFRCGAPVRRVMVAGRSSHFCPRCQPRPGRGQPAPRSRRARSGRATRRVARK
jgi:formamidopyrimidine-DNA glycosylase